MGRWIVPVEETFKMRISIFQGVFHERICFMSNNRTKIIAGLLGVLGAVVGVISRIDAVVAAAVRLFS